MSEFFEDVRQRKGFVARLTGLAILALAVGMAIPLVFSRLAAAFPVIAPFLGLEGEEFGSKAILIPVGMVGITLFCLVLEAHLLGYKDSTAKKIILNETASVRTDVFYTLLRVSGLFMILAMIFSFGWLYVAVGYIKAEFAFAFLKHTDNILIQYVVFVLIFTFVNYWAHRLLHSKVLWEIHKVHHSAEDYNILLPYRNHPVDFILGTLYGVAIATMLGARPETTMLWLSTNAVYQSFVHSRVVWKWRWVEYILIIPEAHRIHHSALPKHFDSNFGILSIWDRLFGTYIPPTGEIFDLGVPDRENFNTDNFVSEMMAVLWRWIGLRRSSAG
ncbi:MAG: sterol desaturase family protein [Alphaproteobacteria bacterium]|nr:sterol desaturase family protein [Alphaproteobacteria bacterium]